MQRGGALILIAAYFEGRGGDYVAVSGAWIWIAIAYIEPRMDAAAASVAIYLVLWWRHTYTEGWTDKGRASCCKYYKQRVELGKRGAAGCSVDPAHVRPALVSRAMESLTPDSYCST